MYSKHLLAGHVDVVNYNEKSGTCMCYCDYETNVLNVVYLRDLSRATIFFSSLNDICNVSPVLFKILYADDTCVLISDNDLNNLIDMLNTELMSLNKWFKANKPSLKTKMLV